MTMDILRVIHTQLLLSVPTGDLQLVFEHSKDWEASVRQLGYIAGGEYYKVLLDPMVKETLSLHSDALNSSSLTLNHSLSIYCKRVIEALGRSQSLFIAVAQLQLFVQHNFTGPQSPINSFDYFYSSLFFKAEEVQAISIKALCSYGQTAYEDCEDPLFLLISLHLLEQLSGARKSLLLNTFDTSEQFSDDIRVDTNDPLLAAINWWRCRAIQVQISLYPEFSGPHIAVSSSLFNESLLQSLCFELDERLQKDLSVLFNLEKTKNLIDSNLEHLVLPNLIQTQKITDFEFVLTGARAKRTKFQQESHSGLIVLAKSNYFSSIDQTNESEKAPETFDLNSDLLLEKPFFESIADEPLDEQIYKRQKTDSQHIDYDKLLPVSLRQEYIPQELQKLDPNNQPNLSDFDNLQLILRLYTLRNTSPAKDTLTDLQSMSLISRIIYQKDPTAVNYSIFARSLWERSIIETTKARTIERGILQMQSLVEEIGLKIKTKYIPASRDKDSISNARLRYIYQLPSLPRWHLDMKLAETYLSLGIVKSAIEIYERLHYETEVALCYASIGEEQKAEGIIRNRIDHHPDDARAISILGDLTQDPRLWEKAWEVGKYAKAKFSLGKYYFYPPDGVVKNIDLSIKHIHDGLSINPINNEQWFFYGCLGLESSQFNLAAEAFTRCVALDDTNSSSWSNLSTALLKLDKVKEAFSALKKATVVDDKKNWRIWENYLVVAAKLGEWNDVLIACKQLVSFKKGKIGEGSIDIPVVEKLVEIMTSNPYPDDPTKLSFFQRSCLEFTTVTLPAVINTSSRLWRVLARVELWRNRPWASLDCHEKAYRALLHNPNLESDEGVWNDCVEVCSDLIAAYESLGELPGKHGAGDVVCKDWKYKSRSTIKSLLSKGKTSWEDSDGWNKLQGLKSSF